MNPIDHPHGGGEGRKSGKGKTPWGKPTKKGKIKIKNGQSYMERTLYTHNKKQKQFLYDQW